MLIGNQAQILEGLIKEQERKDRLDLELQIIRENRREGGGLNQRQRVIQWGVEHPDVVFPRSIAKNGFDANGNFQSGFPKIPYESFRKRLLSDLVKDGIFSVYIDPVRQVPVKGLYTYNNNHGIDSGEIRPIEQWHNLKVEIKEPTRTFRDKNGKKRSRPVHHLLLKAILEDNERFRFTESRNKQKDTWTMKTTWKGRIWTVNIHHGKSKLVEMWLETSKDPLDLSLFSEWVDDIRSVLPDILDNSNPILRIYDINRDFEGMSIPVNQEIKLEVAEDWFIRIYQKGKKVRSEISGVQPIDLVGLQALVKERMYTKDKVEIAKALIELRREHKATSQVLTEVQEFLEVAGFRQESQTLEYSRMTGSIQELIGIFKSAIPKKEDKIDSKWFKPASELVDPTMFG